MIDVQKLTPDMAGGLLCTAILTMALMKASIGKALPPYTTEETMVAMEKIESAVMEVFGPDKGPILLGAFANEFTKSFKQMGFPSQPKNEVPDSKTE